MKAVIQEVQFVKEYDTQFGKMYSFKVKYDDKVAFYSSKYKDQKKFIPGEEVEFTEESKTTADKTGKLHEFWVIKPLNQNKQSNFGKALKKEQARYSAMCVSYAKDLVIAGKINLSEIQDYSWILFELVKKMDDSIEN